MHEYVFKIKKGDIEIELKSDDISFFEQQLNKWRCDLLNIKYEEPVKAVSEEKNEEILPSEIIVDNKNEEQEEQQKEDFNQEIKDLIEETKNNEEEQKQEIESSSEEDLNNQTNFDVLLQESMSQCINNIQGNRDEKFINHVKEKNITEKIDFLITTAYYLEKNENYATFTLNQINKKLTENTFESVDYSVMQDAVENGFAEIVPKDMATETEYKLTEDYKNFVAERAQNV